MDELKTPTGSPTNIDYKVNIYNDTCKSKNINNINNGKQNKKISICLLFSFLTFIIFLLYIYYPKN